MNAALTSKETSTSYRFNVEHDGQTYQVQIWLNEKGKFIDQEIELNEEIIDDDTIEDAIVDYLDKNWDTLTR